jgi:hypothetical protein
VPSSSASRAEEAAVGIGSDIITVSPTVDMNADDLLERRERRCPDLA